MNKKSNQLSECRELEGLFTPLLLGVHFSTVHVQLYNDVREWITITKFNWIALASMIYSNESGYT